MKIFWRDREGRSPPSDALFSWRPFFPDVSIPMGPSIRVTELPPHPQAVPVLNRHFLPDKGGWCLAVEKALGLIRKQELEKIVLARCCVLECATPPDPFAITAMLQSRAQNATLFCLANEEMAFLGATPERLFKREKDRIESEAIAGTRKRGKTPEEDVKWEKELLSSSKDLREFAPVHNFLSQSLAPLCFGPIASSPLQVCKTKTVQHLYIHLSGALKKGITDREILDQIHPTPALCGWPKKNAFGWIRNLEPFERGLYGGAIGWSAPDAAEWVVAIRSCLIRGRFVYLYTGTGIVEGSDPEAEWDELNVKMKLYEEIFL